MNEISIGILGGSGLYKMKELCDVEEIKVETPFGDPSDHYIVGTLGKKRVAFLPRHGRGHRLMPTEINYRANIFGFKKIGVRQILSVSAVGSLKLEHEPMDVIVPDQFIDRTRNRVSTFFGDGIAAHVGFGDPVCAELANYLERGAENASVPLKKGGTYVCMEGPAFSTRAESNLYRSWGADIIGMTNLTEAKLAREAEVCYITMAMVTDYDCWHSSEEDVSVQMVLEYLNRNNEAAQKILKETVRMLPEDRVCACQDALESAIITQPDCVTGEARERLGLIIDRYLPVKEVE
jgi:5'-methylthioadenosine phosphorylase